MTMHKALHPRDNIDYVCQEKKELDDPPELKIAWMHRYEESNATEKGNKD